MLFTEDFLHYVWKFRLFDYRQLQTTTGEPLEIISVGQHNTHAGPDFQNARIRIGHTLWAGNVEIHLTAADWRKHSHTIDGAYHNVILHVVYHQNETIVLPDGRVLPALELKDRINPDLHLRYHQLINGHQQIIPCEGSIHAVNKLTVQNWLTRVLVERLENKAATVLSALDVNQGDWEENFYQFLAAGFGFKVNALPFELLTRSLPQKILARHKGNPLQIEALIFGQAGLLNGEFTDAYPNALKTEYLFLRQKYSLVPIEGHLWKFLRLRPQNFPTIRLAQFAALIVQSSHLFSKILKIDNVRNLSELFSDGHVNGYWNTHYRFDAAVKPMSASLGKASINGLLLNVVATFLFGYGNRLQLQEYITRSLQLLEELQPERNHIVTEFELLGVKAKTAFESQALLELKNKYCNFKKCLQCGIGNQILNVT